MTAGVTVTVRNCDGCADLIASDIRLDDSDFPNFDIIARISNIGDLRAETGTRVSFYDGDPDAGGILLGTVTTENPLNPGDCEDVRLGLAVMGTHLGPELRVTSSGKAPGYPAIAQDDVHNHIYVAWAEGGGSGWREDVLCYGIHTVYTSQHLGNGFNLFYKKFRYDPVSDTLSQVIPPTEDFPAGQIAVTTDGGTYQKTDLALDSEGNVHIVWHDDGGEVLHVRLSGADGSVLVPAARVSPESLASPSVATDSTDNVHIVCLKGQDIFYKKLDRDGTALTRDTVLTARADSPGIIVDPEGNPVIAWADRRDGQREIYLTMLNGTSGDRLISDVRVSDDGNAESGWRWPAMAAGSDGVIHFAWRDRRDGTWQIWYRQTKIMRAGNYTVSLRVTDNTGQTSPASSLTLNIGGNQPPAALFGYSGQMTADALITFDASASSDPEGHDLTYAWDFDGDGNSDETGSVVSRAFPAGDPAVTLTVTDDRNLTGTVSVALHIVSPGTAPQADFDITAGRECRTGRRGRTASPGRDR